MLFLALTFISLLTPFYGMESEPAAFRDSPSNTQTYPQFEQRKRGSCFRALCNFFCSRKKTKTWHGIPLQKITLSEGLLHNENTSAPRAYKINENLVIGEHLTVFDCIDITLKHPSVKLFLLYSSDHKVYFGVTDRAVHTVDFPLLNYIEQSKTSPEKDKKLVIALLELAKDRFEKLQEPLPEELSGAAKKEWDKYKKTCSNNVEKLSKLIEKENETLGYRGTLPRTLLGVSKYVD